MSKNTWVLIATSGMLVALIAFQVLELIAYL